MNKNANFNSQSEDRFQSREFRFLLKFLQVMLFITYVIIPTIVYGVYLSQVINGEENMASNLFITGTLLLIIFINRVYYKDLAVKLYFLFVRIIDHFHKKG